MNSVKFAKILLNGMISKPLFNKLSSSHITGVKGYVLESCVWTLRNMALVWVIQQQKFSTVCWAFVPRNLIILLQMNICWRMPSADT